MTAKIDLQESSTISLSKDGYRATRVAIVSNVSGTAAEVLFNAISDAQLPDIGDAHPDVATITLQDLSCTGIGGGKFKVTMNYFKDAGTVTASSDAESRATTAISIEETNRDVNGQPMRTSYLGGGLPTYEGWTAEIEVPRVTYVFEYTAASLPTDKIIQYLNKINSTTWNNHAAGTILCSGIDADQAGDDFRVRFSFSFRKQGWQFVARTRYLGEIAPLVVDPDLDIDYENGSKTYDMYQTVDFNPLGFGLDNLAGELQANTGKIIITGFDATLTHTVP